MSERNLINAREVARRLGIARGTVYNLASAGKLAAVKVFGALRFEPQEIERLIERGKINQPGKGGEDE